jgi:CMP-N-acetylneuraminic acid synthetase
VSLAAIIPARKNSRRIQGKNMQPMCGKPLIDWTLDLAINAAPYWFDRVFVTTDWDAVADHVNAIGCPDIEVVRRPEESANGEQTMDGVVSHLYKFLGHRIVMWDQFCLLQVTHPLRTRDQLDRFLGFTTVISCDQLLTVNAGGYLENGLFYYWNHFHWQRRGSLRGPGTMVMENLVDVDTHEDFAYAERLLSERPWMVGARA